MSRFAKRVMVSILALAILLATTPMLAASAETKAWSRNEDGFYINNKGDIIVGALRRGVDVSEWNGTIDWEKAKADDVGFAIIRVGGRYMTGRNFYFDSQFERNVAECERLGIPYGVYFFSTAKTAAEGREEAQFTLAHLQNHNPTMPIYIDMEWEEIGSTSNRQMLANVATAFCETIAAAGLEPGVYANTNWFTNYLTDPCFDRWTRWVAQYYSVCQYEGTYDMWQCTSSAKIAGFSGTVDVNMDLRPKWGQTAEWVYEGSGWKYKYEDGTYAKGALVYIEGLVYCFDSNGYVQSGWQQIEDGWYYFDPTTNAMQRGWLILDGAYYYLDLASGKATVGWTTINGTYYCFGSDCKLMVNSWATYNGKLFYLDKYGHITTRRWLQDPVSGAWYYLGSDGAAYTNQWLDYGGARYRFGSDSKLVVNSWVKVDGKLFYLGADGKLVQNRFITTDGKLYYVDETSNPVTGWQRLSDETGEAWYYFGSDFVAFAERWLKYENGWYFFGSDCKLVLDRWIQYQGAWYLIGTNGQPVTDTWVQGTDGAWYYLGSGGTFVTDTWVQTDGAWYYVGASGKRVVSDWVLYGGRYYFVDANGHPLTNTYIDYGNKRYYFGSAGYCTGSGPIV